MSTSWRRRLIEQMMIADLHQAVMKQFRHEGHFVGPPASVTKAIGKTFEALDDGDLDGAEHWIDVAERRVVAEGAALRADPSTWLAQQHTEATA